MDATSEDADAGGVDGRHRAEKRERERGTSQRGNPAGKSSGVGEREGGFEASGVAETQGGIAREWEGVLSCRGAPKTSE